MAEPCRARPVVVCLHASAASGGQWNALAEMLGSECDVLTPDLHGHAGGPPWRGGSPGIVAADTAIVARLAAQSGRAHLIGHSYGAAIALRVALCMPEHVASVAVYEPVALRVLFDDDASAPATVEIRALAAAIERESQTDTASAARRFVDYWAGAPQWETLTDRRRAAIARCIPAVRAHFAALVRDPFRLANYEHLDKPVLYLAGERTRAPVRRIGELLRRALPQVDAATLRGMGHLGPVTHAADVARRFASFVRSVVQDQAAATGSSAQVATAAAVTPRMCRSAPRSCLPS